MFIAGTGGNGNVTIGNATNVTQTLTIACPVASATEIRTPTIDSTTALYIGKTSATSINIGRTNVSVNTSIVNSSTMYTQSIDRATTGALSIGTTFATPINIGRTGIAVNMSTLNTSTISTPSIDTVASGTLSIGTTNATPINIGRTGIAVNMSTLNVSTISTNSIVASSISSSGNLFNNVTTGAINIATGHVASDLTIGTNNGTITSGNGIFGSDYNIAYFGHNSPTINIGQGAGTGRTVNIGTTNSTVNISTVNISTLNVSKISFPGEGAFRMLYGTSNIDTDIGGSTLSGTITIAFGSTFASAPTVFLSIAPGTSSPGGQVYPGISQITTTNFTLSARNFANGGQTSSWSVSWLALGL
jgi:hypothetical protein